MTGVRNNRERKSKRLSGLPGLSSIQEVSVTGYRLISIGIWETVDWCIGINYQGIDVDLEAGRSGLSGRESGLSDLELREGVGYIYREQLDRLGIVFFLLKVRRVGNIWNQLSHPVIWWTSGYWSLVYGYWGINSLNLSIGALQEMVYVVYLVSEDGLHLSGIYRCYLVLD